LAVLSEGSCYGYQLRTELDRRTGSRGPVNVGQIYNTLDRLERDKLVRKAGGETGAQSNYFEITDAGRREASAWFETPETDPSEVGPKLALAAGLAHVQIADVVRVQREFTMERLRNTQAVAAPSTPEELATAVVASTERLELEAQLRGLDAAETLIADTAARGFAAMPLATEVPKRGRPPKTIPVAEPVEASMNSGTA
jgi:DNA-binding PadR family transcriptional regulator